jgi:phenylalanyl-tRNA synthetase beta chain
MRQTLLFGGLETIVHNYNRKKHDLRIYEFGNTYQMTRDKRQKSKVHSDNSYYIEESRLSMLMTGRIYNETWKTPDENVSIFEIKYHITNILRYTGLEISNMKFEKYEDDIFGTGIIFSDERNNEILRFGELTKKILEIFGIKTTVFYADINWDNLVELSEKKDIKYKEVSKYPEVRRDIAMLIDKGIQYSDIEKLVYSSGKKLLKKVDLFDVYEGEKIGNDKKSYAISLIMQDEEKTLTDNEVDRVIEKIKGEIIKEFKAIIR